MLKSPTLLCLICISQGCLEEHMYAYIYTHINIYITKLAYAKIITTVFSHLRGCEPSGCLTLKAGRLGQSK